MHICEGGAAANRDRKNYARYPDERRHDRTPLVPECRSDFPIPFPEIYRMFCAQTFSVEFISAMLARPYWAVR